MPGPSGEAVTAENVARAVKTVIMKKSTDPGRIHWRESSYQWTLLSDYAENLAYDVNKEFGDSLLIWLGEDRNRNKGTESKVKLKPFIRTILTPQAREWVSMWKSHLGEDANLSKFVEILEKRSDCKDSVAQLKKTFAL